MTLAEYIRYLGWSAAELARHAGVDQRTVAKALRGEPVKPHIARLIAEGLSEAMEKRIHPGDVEGLIIEG